ncbi:hypothetical protein V6N13_051047 [Hibiscus sabdariffa]
MVSLNASSQPRIVFLFILKSRSEISENRIFFLKTSKGRRANQRNFSLFDLVVLRSVGSCTSCLSKRLAFCQRRDFSRK